MKLLGVKVVARVALSILVLSVTLGAMKIANSGQADAASKSATDSINYVVDGPLWLHPDSPTVHSTVTDLIPTGGEFDIQCFALGDNVNGDTAWDYGTNPATGDTGYVSDYYVNTNDTRGNEANQLPQEGISECGSQNTGDTQPNIANPDYNRMAAVNWALAHAQDPQSHDEECAYFVSQALWAGGLPQTDKWNGQGGYWTGSPLHGNLPAYFTGTETANYAPDLIQYLEQNFSTQWIALGRMNADNNNIPEAQVGDIIAYSWHGTNADGTASIDHLALIVGFAADNPQYPLVAEWGQFSWNLPVSYFYNNIANPTSPYAERGWTWSALDNTWLQNENGQQNMTAYLLHFNGGYTIPNY